MSYMPYCPISRAPLGGGDILPPPLEYSRYLENYVRYRHQTFSDLIGINLTPCLKILPNLVGFFFEKMTFQ